MIINGVDRVIKSSADLRYAYLRSADLSSADLRYADLRYAYLRSADLSYADLSYADLRYADLRYAYLRSADLRYADLSYADLRYADLSYADLRYAYLRSADLSYADLWGAVIQFCNFSMIKKDESEKKAETELQKIINTEQFTSYINYGYFCEGNTIFSIDELVRTGEGIWCVEIKSPEKLPRADKIIHRLLLYRHKREEFFKIAQKQFER